MNDQVLTLETRLEATLDDAAGHLNAQHGRLIDTCVELLERPALWRGDGVWTIEAYLAWRCGVSRSTASKISGLAQRVEELPDTVAAVRAGELSLDQADPIARHCPRWADAQVARLARMLTVTQIRRLVKKYPWDDDAPVADDSTTEDPATVVPDPPDTSPGDREPVQPVDECWYGHDDTGRWRMWITTDTDTGQIIEAALDEARDHLFSSGHTDVNSVDALREIAQRSRTTITPTSRRDHYRINIHLERDGTCTDRLGRALPDAIARHLSCDGLLTPILFQNGHPVSVGRSQHLVPERTRRVVEHRDGGCRVPGCDATHHLEIHHIIHWTNAGPTDTWNLVALCPHHHRLHHHGRLGITGNADDHKGLVFTDANGRVMAASGARPQPPGAPPPPTTGTWHHPHGEPLHTWWLAIRSPPPEHHRATAS